jgi:hypothetical protein
VCIDCILFKFSKNKQQTVIQVEKENDRASEISHNIRCEGRGYKDGYWKLLKMGRGGKGVRKSNGRGWIDQSKAHPQWAYIETPFWAST